MRPRKYIKCLKEWTLQEPSKNMVYIAGKVTGLDYNKAQRKFDNAAAYLELNGFVAVSPMDFVHPEATWEEAMKISLNLLIQSDMIWMLPGWQDSKGATLEREIAMKTGIPFFEPNQITKP